jgi:hypothetical protein
MMPLCIPEGPLARPITVCEKPRIAPARRLQRPRIMPMDLRDRISHAPARRLLRPTLLVSLFALLGAACGASPAPTTAPATDVATCDEAGAAFEASFLKEMTAGDEPGEPSEKLRGEGREIRRVVSTHCSDDAWTAEQRTCQAKRVSGVPLDECPTKLSKAQLEKFEPDFIKVISDAAGTQFVVAPPEE